MAKKNEDPRQALKEEQQARADLERQNEIANLRDLLTDPRVRNFLWRIMGRAKMFQSRFSPNAAVMGFNEGFADMGVLIYNEIIEAYPDAWILMQQEALQRQRDADLLAAIEADERRALATE